MSRPGSDRRPHRGETGSGPPTEVAEITVLAATARAELHERTFRGKIKNADLRTIALHLGWAYHSGSTRRLRPHLGALTASGALEARTHRRHRYWAVTAEGRRRLIEAGAIELPEAPQHRAWRRDRRIAAEGLDSFRARARRDLDEGCGLLARDERPAPAELRELGRRLTWDLRVLASAIACLHEWPEPDDAERDEGRPWNSRDFLTAAAGDGTGEDR
ncbi:MAG: hypothetical protein JSU06_00380 [Actinobacteria bacterium]|nr:hypothetical protein [Actinomycetota bacterium]